MDIENKSWTAQINRMPGDAFFRVDGVITLPRSGFQTTLIVSEIQDKSFDLRLDLEVAPGCWDLPVVSDHKVSYKQYGPSHVTGVTIMYDGKVLHHIDDILITH